jgi:hypothetical protein
MALHLYLVQYLPLVAAVEPPAIQITSLEQMVVLVAEALQLAL